MATIDPLGNRTSLAYDSAGRPIRRQNPLGKIVTNVYDNAGRQVAPIDPLGHRITNVYDAACCPITSVNALVALARKEARNSGQPLCW
jgi:YD repeat-containing protein